MPSPSPRPEVPEEGEHDPATRHAVAGGGKNLPGQDDSAGTDDDRSEVDAPFAWFGITLPPPPEGAPAIVAVGQPVAAIELPEGDAALLPGIALPEAALPAAALPAAALPAAALPEAPTEGAPAPALPAGEKTEASPAFALPQQSPAPALPRQIQGIELSRVRADLPARIELPAKIELPADSPILQTIAALQPRAEAQPLAATLAAATGIELPDPFRRPAPRDTLLNTVAPTSATEILRPHVVQAVADAQQAAIDTRRSEWMSQTIDRIEALRDSPNSRETSIRLSPDALGTVDVSIRHEGDRVHVRFTAENAQARTLLTEAQSRLTEIAEARGLKLGQTSVDSGVSGGTAGQGQRHDAAPKTATASAPPGVPGSETERATDDRIA
ncbi:flagellar hook-length control protein FliK [Sphingomonas sp. LB-2]|nr:flagellar hook-length control protein FliK [Sphingomonas caeni]